MNKLIIGVVIVLLLGAGAYYLYSRMNVSPMKKVTDSVMKEKESAGNMFTSIKDAMGKSMSLSCDYTNDGGAHVKTYVKGGAVRVQTDDPKNRDGVQDVILKDSKMYMWSETTKAGFMYTIKAPESISPQPSAIKEESETGAQSGDKQESVLAQIEKFKDSCKAGTVADSMFTVPTDVKFQDMDAMMKQLVPSGVPSTTGSADYQQYVKDMMKQYAPTGQ